MFLLVPAYPGCPGSKAVKRSLLLLCRLQAHVAQSSSSQGRLQQQLTERDAVIRDRDVRIASLQRELADSQSSADSLTSRLGEHELVISGKDRRISELNALIGDRSRSLLFPFYQHFITLTLHFLFNDMLAFPSVLWHCSLGARKSIRPVRIE